jgi:anti-sigma factor RsiW
MSSTHDEVMELLGAYALDAVDPDEAALVEDHLRTCPRCQAEVAEHREVAAMLAHSGAPAPEGLWDRISSSLEETPPELSLPLGRGEVVDLGERRRARPATRWLPAAAAAAAVLVVAGVVAGFNLADDDGGPDRAPQVAAPALEDLARAVLNDPDARRATLAAPEGAVEVAAPAAVAADGAGFLLGSSLPALDPSRTYQLWGVSDRVIVSLGVLGSSPGVITFHVDEGIHTLVITEEEAGGVPSSSNPPFLAGELS